MNFCQTELLNNALADELAARFASELAEQYGDAVAQFIASTPANRNSFENLARKIIGIVPESRICKLLDASTARKDKP